jgi:hypothetical protein
VAEEKLTPQQIANINEMEYYKVHGYKCIGDMLVNIPMIDIRGLQIYMYETYGVDLIIHAPAAERPVYSSGIA